MRHAYVTTGSTQPRIKSLSAAAATLAWPFVTACPDLTRSEAPAAPYTLISRREIAFRTVRLRAHRRVFGAYRGGLPASPMAP